MTSEKAWKKIKGLIHELRDMKYIEYKKYTDVIQELVDKDTPYSLKENNNLREECKCKCGYDFFTHIVYPFCPMCGQKVKSDDFI